MKRTSLACIAPLLKELRRHPSLREVRPTVFYFNDRDFLHFHDDEEGIFADVRLARGFERLPVTTRAEQLELLGRIDECLSMLDSRIVRKQRRDPAVPR